ncbi:MAG: recombinase family protein [Ignisphaera sp.]
MFGEVLLYREVCGILGVTNRTLRRWISEGRVRAVNVYGRWRIPESEVRRLLGQPVEEFKEAKFLRAVVYGRVSGSSQKRELENQVEALKKYVEQNGWRLVAVVTDVASGLSEDRRGLRKVLDMGFSSDAGLYRLVSSPHLFSPASRSGFHRA